MQATLDKAKITVAGHQFPYINLPTSAGPNARLCVASISSELGLRCNVNIYRLGCFATMRQAPAVFNVG